MPLIRVDLPRSLFDESGPAMSTAIHRAQINALDIPPDDKFQVFHPHEEGEMIFDPTYGGVDRRRLIVIQIVMVRRYTVEIKRRLYRAIVEGLTEVGIRAEDLQIAVVENYYEDWFAGTLPD